MSSNWMIGQLVDYLALHPRSSKGLAALHRAAPAGGQGYTGEAGVWPPLVVQLTKVA